ncbi:MAG: hypothetical protein ABIP54_02180 [Candidatus Andersenbacteria bacterium]
MAAPVPETPMVNAGLLYVSGLQLSNDATTPLTLLDVAAGACRDSTNTNDIVVSSAVVVNLAGTGALGIDTGTVAASTMYAVYAVGSSTNQIGNGQPVSAYPGTVLLSLSFTQPTLPFNYDMFRRIGTVVTDSSSHILAFRQDGSGQNRRMTYATPIATAITAGNATTNTSVVINTTPTVPAIATLVHFSIGLTPTTAGNKVILVPTGAGASDIYAQLSGDVAAVVHTDALSCPCSATPQVSYRVTAGGDAVAISVQGFDDLL